RRPGRLGVAVREVRHLLAARAAEPAALGRLVRPVRRAAVVVETEAAEARRNSMSWDGIPEHRNLGGDGEQPKKPPDALRDIRGGPAKPPASLPADPFSGTDEGAIATYEIFRSHVAAGFTEQQVLFYQACLIHVGIAMKRGGLLPPPEEP